MTLKILSALPFPKKLANIPEYAGGHHEKLDGSGYPMGLKGDVLPLQARIMAIADVFEALTAPDRPYKEPMKLSQALKILGFMEKDNHIDPDILELFVENKIYHEYAESAMRPEQVDI
jgi:HD-GYP domain-containing protein (c-di-GMP phosphodiesterase class II)